jgi:hypothetical protein
VQLQAVPGAEALCRPDAARSAERSFAAEARKETQVRSEPPVWQPWSVVVAEVPRVAEELLPACWNWQTVLRPAEQQAVVQSE